MRAKLDLVQANDLMPDAVEEIKENVQYNEVDVKISQGDANRVLYTTDPWDVIDVDPYGSIAPFLESAIYNVKNYGFICATSTDMATLCGNHPET